VAEEKKKKATSGKEAYPNHTKKQTAEKAKPQKTASAKKNEKNDGAPSFGHQIVMILLAVFAIFIAICFIFPSKVGLVGYGLAMGFFGLFGLAAFLVPALMLFVAYFWKKDVMSGAVRYRYLFAIGVLVLLAAIIHAFRGMALHEEYTFASAFTWEQLKRLFVDGSDYQGGGFIGGAVALLLICAVGYPGTLIFGFLFLIVLTLALFGLTPTECVQRCTVCYQRSRDKRLIRKEKRMLARAAEEAAEKKERERAASLAREENEEDESDEEGAVACVSEKAAVVRPRAEISISGSGIDPAPQKKDAIDVIADDEDFEETVPATANVVPTLSASPESAKKLAWDPDDKLEAEEYASDYTDDDGDDDYDYDELPGDGDVDMDPVSEEIEIRPPDPMVEAPATVDDEVPEEIPSPPEYEFPPIDLLQPPEEVSRDESVSQELRENADKIIETLESFHVHVNISHVSRGPTVTRYELEPAAGTRVRSITNLLDDIALSLATSGVRSDGIITGKSAIGIEVPNKTVNTVFIRELIEDERFVDAKSRLTTCLGMDVSGAPVYLDVAKMPHLLIAGATGMGKSVCINSLLVSLLYKARPDEVKLILIDPKKVELNIYNGIPHLLVPVVFDPKKAAGSLHWAVTEMERRFELIESKNTRNIAQYNAAIADDPTQEFLPQIVIIIDELADLMMSAPDDVEASICRLAQKARAAGMHLIIGTQRPSVDVITGLIKANIPSRIAFTVASQIDSRTIIDAQGAEKLIGRGDMLYAPVGASKPIRVQGAFVSETEIEEIVDCIRAQSFGAAYSDEVMAQINRAAELCGQKKGKAAAATAAVSAEGSAEDDDPMLDSAIELAVESGKISTSLIQRRLQLGYGRAAKIIDMMERRGIVSAPEGQKPRAVLITREQYLEMQMHSAERAESLDDASV
jgi:S-DNA-T family DNA segregation ATPase FtsK/SpoIIIE